MIVKQLQIKSLGNSSYIIVSEREKVCAVVDPVRDVDIYIREAEAMGVSIAYSLETHLHNDYVSGSRELAARTEAVVCAPAAAGLMYEHRPLKGGDSIHMGEVEIKVLHTPGHTPEHVSFLASDASDTSKPQSLFSGGALLVGGVARTDMMGKDLAPFLGRWFHKTIKQVFEPLPDEVAVFPTHGGGSYCLASPAGSHASTTTIGQERRTNQFFKAGTAHEFLELSLSDLPSYPRYYGRMAAVNLRGPRILGGLPGLYPLSPREVWVRTQGESAAIDTRRPDDYAAAHIPGSYCMPFGGSAGTWVGWLIDGETPLVLVDDDPAHRQEMVRQLVRIGYDQIDGYLDGGMDAWRGARLPVASLAMTSAGEVYAAGEGGNGPVPLDVRFGYEWREGHVPDAIHVELGQLQSRLGDLPREKPYAVFCAAGNRSTTAASIMERAGFRDVRVVAGGMGAWWKADLPVEM